MKADQRYDYQHRFPARYTKNDDCRGQTLVEYVLILVVISIVLITAMQFFQGKVSSTYNKAASSIPHSP